MLILSGIDSVNLRLAAYAGWDLAATGPPDGGLCLRLARVVGQVVSTVKESELTGLTLLLVRDVEAEDADKKSRTTSGSYVAADLVGAGEGEVVLVATGSAARVAARMARAPVDVAVVAIVDSVIVEARTTFRKA